MNKLSLRSFFAFLLSLAAYTSNAQCSAVTIQPQGTCTGTAFTGQNISSGTYISNGNNTISGQNVIISEGTLIVCSGNLTFTSSQVYAGFNSTGPVHIIINSGATLTITIANLFLYTNATITNYGTLNVQSGGFSFISGYNNGTVVNTVNGVLTSAVGITMNGTNGRIINYGNMTTTGITVNASSNICLGSASRLSANNLTNAGTNHSMFNLVPGASQGCLQLPSGNSYTPGGTGNVISNEPGVRICSGNATTPTAANAGNATVNYNCTSCSVVLPLNVTGFSATKAGDKAVIAFSTANEKNVAGFEVERGNKEGSYKRIGNYIPAHNELNNQYELTDNQPEYGDNYYRIKIMELDNTVSYTNGNKLSFINHSSGLSLYPNPASEGITLRLPDYTANTRLTVSISDLTGKTVNTLYSGDKGNAPAAYSVKNIPAGIYVLCIIAGNEVAYKEKLVIVK